MAKPTVVVVDKRGTREVAEAYLITHLYSLEGQTIAAKNYHRPRDKQVSEQFANQFPQLQLFTVENVFSSRQKAQQVHFSSGGILLKSLAASKARKPR